MTHEELVAALLRPEAYPHPVAQVRHVQTHISSLFLTGGRVYKLKRPVRFDFLDFTSLARREHFCREEFRLNSRLAPLTYLGVEPVRLGPDGVRVGGPGETVDWVVVMRELRPERMGLRVLEEGGLAPGLIEAMVDQLVPFYQAAATGPEVDQWGLAPAIRYNAQENFKEIQEYVGLALSAERLAEIEGFTAAFLHDQADLLARRVREGRIRECHGDLHLANICFEDPPVIYDCLEFSSRFRCSDVAADLAFLAMDLDFHGREDLGRQLVASYVARSGDAELPALMAFYKCYRACVRGKIQALTWDDASVRGEAKGESLRLSRRYFALAHAYAQGRARPALVVLHGLMGSGKSALGRWLWGRFGWPTLRSDALRKRLAGLAETAKVTEPFGQGLYAEAVTERVYREMLAQAEERLIAGLPVVLDGSYGRQAHRRAVADLAARTGARLVFIKTVCDLPEQRSRLARRPRTKNASDGRVELMVKQAEVFDPPGPAEAGRLIILDTDGPKALTRAMAEAELKRHGLAD